MTPEQLVQILVALNVTGAVGILWQWWSRRQENSDTRQHSYEERLQLRIDELERAQEERDAAKDAEIRGLRLLIAECQEGHAATREIAARVTAQYEAASRQVLDLQRQIDALNESLGRRRSGEGRNPT